MTLQCSTFCALNEKYYDSEDGRTLSSLQDFELFFVSIGNMGSRGEFSYTYIAGLTNLCIRSRFIFHENFKEEKCSKKRGN
jgi:hypothetical protein